MWRKAVVVSCARPNHRGVYPYNLGARKCADWLRDQGVACDYYDGDPGLPVWEAERDIDLVALSVLFSWQAEVALRIALLMEDRAEVWCGGPGMSGLISWWKLQTGLLCHRGIDDRFDRQRGDYLMTFGSRGCDQGCYFCVVPGIEGRTFTLDYDFQPAPILCDNNLSGLPVAFQEHIISRYQVSGVSLLDANSGFAPFLFDEECYRRWKPILRGPWRFALDEMREVAAVEDMMKILREEPPKRKRCYVMIGNEPLEQCWERVLQVIAWGGEPYSQLWLQPSWLGDPRKLKTRFDWTFERGRDFCRYVNRFVWRSAPLDAYSNRKYAPPPFAESPVATPAWRRRWEAALADHRRFVRRSHNHKPPLQAGQAAQTVIDLLQDSLFDELDELGTPHEPF
jgi:hypothetical protein